MRRSIRFVLYLMVGFIIYQIIDSGESPYTHDEVKNVLIIAIVVVFVLLVIVRAIKQRYDDRE